MKLRLANKKYLSKASPAPRKIVSAPQRQLPRVAAATPKALLSDVRELILVAREQVARAVDSGLVTLYWHIGRRVHQDVLKEKRAEYGEKIVATLSRQWEAEFGRGFTEKNLRRMVQFAEVFSDEQIVATLRRQLGWSHFKEIIPLQDELKRDFYAEMCRIERWSVRTLRQKIGGMLFERTALSKKPDKLIRRELAALRDEDKLTPDLVFRDPYVRDFLGLKDTYSEKDIEAAILREMEAFILELGTGFCFVQRQKRMQIDSRDYYLDLLFYHRKLRSLIAIDLKLEEFEAADKGQMELYLNWLKKKRTRRGRSAAAWHHPVCGQTAGTRRTAANGTRRHPRRQLRDEGDSEKGIGTEASPSRPFGAGTVGKHG